MENEVRAKEDYDYGVRVWSSWYMVLAKKLTSKCQGKQVSVDTESCASAPKSRELWLNSFASFYLWKADECGFPRYP